MADSMGWRLSTLEAVPCGDSSAVLESRPFSDKGSCVMDGLSSACATSAAAFKAAGFSPTAPPVLLADCSTNASGQLFVQHQAHPRWPLCYILRPGLGSRFLYPDALCATRPQPST